MALTSFVMRHKRLASVLLILCVVIFNIYALQQQAHAFALTAVGLLVAAAVTLLIAGGLVFATSEAAKEAAEAFVAEKEEQIQNVINTGRLVYQAGKAAYKYVASVSDEAWQAVVDYIHEHYTAGKNINAVQPSVGSYPSSSTVFMSASSFLSMISSVSGFSHIISYYSLYNNLSSYDGLLVAFFDYSFNLYSIGLCDALRYYSDDPTYFHSISSYVYTPDTGKYYNFDITANRLSDGDYIYTNIADFYDDTGVYGDSEILDDDDYDWVNGKTGTRDIGVELVPADVIGVTDADVYADDGTALVAPISDIATKTAADVIADDLTGISTDDDLTVDPEAEADYNLNNYRLPDLRDYFPFCVPFDVIALVKTLNATPEAPVFEIPVPFGFAGYEGTLTLDLSQFSEAAEVFRWGMTMLYILGLVLLTRKLIRA